MKKRRLRGFVVPVFSAFLISVLFIALISFNKKGNTPIKKDKYTYVNDSIIHDAVPTLSEDDVIIKPFQNDNIKLYKSFYDKENGSEDSIIYYNDTYIQNSGCIYNHDEEFAVVSILDGEVIDVKKEELLGYIVEVKHSDNLISSYEGLKSVNVKKGEQITQNTMIGKSGEIKLDVNLKNALLFEMIKDGKYINPEIYYNKKLKEI
ncbi:MAG: M23 family metallopeptidase [Bacilli bacterium]|nr:M23 family metallopeptidase [Bacilli bacterium]